MEPMIFCKIGWMKKYQGLVNDSIKGGGADKNKVSHEVYNFLDVDDKYYGHVRTKNGSDLKLDRIVNTYNDQGYIDNVTVVWVSKKPEGGVYVVGWYKNARIYKDLQSPPINRIEKIDEDLNSSKKENSELDYSGKNFPYFFEANVSESTLLDEEDRTFKLPKRKIAQTNHWYADKEEDLDVKTKINNYITHENTDEKLNNRKNINNMFSEDIMKKIEFNQYLKEKGFYFNQKTIENFLLSLKVKPFLILTGNSGTGKTKLAQLFAKYIEETKIDSFNDNRNYKIIAIGSNWTDGSEIIGYYNMINDKYIQKPSLTLSLEAMKNTEHPYFLILDEMNLSHVERYFNDFLSSIESGEPIYLHNKENQDIPNYLELPNNLFVIGTVNVDETTYMFSPKVLDRANVLEFETVSPKKLFNNENLQENSFNNEYLSDPLSDTDLKNCSLYELKNKLSDVKTSSDENVYTSDENVYNLIIESLDKLHNILKKVGFDFGFRVINEVLKFMYVAWKYEGKPGTWDNWNRYFDTQIKQKILPKLHGSERLLQNILCKLFDFTLGETTRNYPRDVDLMGKSPKFRTSATKIKNMDQILSEQHYVSFIN